MQAQAALLEALPDLVAMVRRDGVLLSHVGGREVSELCPVANSVGKNIDEIWPQPLANLLKQLLRRVLSTRGVSDAEFALGDRQIEVRVSAQGADRALCSMRRVAATRRGGAEAETGQMRAPQFERRGFLRRFRNTVNTAALAERPVAVAVILVDGLVDISRIMDADIAERVTHTALNRLPVAAADATGVDTPWYLGRVNEDTLVVVMETAERAAIERCLAQLEASLRDPVPHGDAMFHLTPHTGVAILGQDANTPRILLDHARSAAVESRRSKRGSVRFFSDTLQLRSLARLDVARELRDAISNGEVRLRFVGRHDLESGRLVTRVGYLRWIHPLRGVVPPTEFLAAAQATGLATLLSRSILKQMQHDFAAALHNLEPSVRISIGPLRHHILQDNFVKEILDFLDEGMVPPERLELRIGERAYVLREPGIWQPLVRLGVQLVVDEVGRGMASVDLLARTPLAGLQLDRSWVTALPADPLAQKVCQVGISMALALGMTPIATGVDGIAQRTALLALGCQQGLGDYYPAPV